VGPYTAVQIKNCSKSTSVIKITSIKNMDNFQYAMKAIMQYCQIESFVVSKDKWYTKEGMGKSMKSALYVLRYAKRLK